MAYKHCDYYPTLITKIEVLGTEVTDVIFLPESDAVVISDKARRLRISQPRDNGRYHDSATEVLPSPAIHLLYNSEDKSLFAGSENGTIFQYRLQDDLNAFLHVHDYLHTAPITSLILDVDYRLLISTCGKSIVFDSPKTRKCIDMFETGSRATFLAYDASRHRLFVGQDSGAISIFDIEYSENRLKVMRVRDLLKDDKGITYLFWDNTRSRLFSCAGDSSVVFWDLSGPKELHYKLQAHTGIARSVCYWANGKSPIADCDSGLAISGGSDGLIVIWFFKNTRVSPPDWTMSDICVLCTYPFYWNLFGRLSNKRFAIKGQHHCRHCGKAVCGDCSKFTKTIPLMGIEKPVRVCDKCLHELSDADDKSLAVLYPTYQRIGLMKLNEAKNILLTVQGGNMINFYSLAKMAASNNPSQRE